MKLFLSPHRHQAGYTRREWLIGGVVALALMATTAMELRHRPAPACAGACSPCGGDAVSALDRWVASQTNAPAPVVAPAPGGS